MSDILGLEKVIEHLSKHNDCYVIIGGIATKIGLIERGFLSRETKDFDMVVLADASNNDFAHGIVNLLKDGKYQNGYSNERKSCYRFINPETNGYPKIIELFAKDNNKLINHHIEKIPIAIDDEQLSAIVLNEDVFNFVKERKTISKEGLPIVDVLGLIALKVYAYFQNLDLYKQGKIDSKNNYNKHRSDVIRLLLSLDGNETPINMPELLKTNCINFLEILKGSNQILKSIPNHNVSLDTLVSLFKRIFC